MESLAARGSIMDRKTISISSKRQVTIPQKFFDALGFGTEAECVLQNGALVIRPVRNNGGEFAEQILADLIAQGYSGDELLSQFKEAQTKVRPAMEKIIAQADALGAAFGDTVSLDDLFGAED